MADVIYEGQSYLRLTVNSGISLSSAVITRINYRKPSGAGGFWPADSVSGNAMIGAGYNQSAFYYSSANIDEVIIDNRAWSQAEIINKYAADKGFF